MLNILCTCQSCLDPRWLPLQTLTEDKYEVRSSVSQSAIWVVNINDPKFSLKVTLSSLAMRDEHTAKDQGIYPSVCPLIRFSFKCNYLNVWFYLKNVNKYKAVPAGANITFKIYQHVLLKPERLFSLRKWQFRRGWGNEGCTKQRLKMTRMGCGEKR